MQGHPMRRRSRRSVCQGHDPLDGATVEAMAAYDRALMEIERIDRAQALTRRRLVVMEEMILACREAMDDHTEDQDELRRALDGLIEDLAKMQETLPIERAFLADERDRALLQMRHARKSLPFSEAEGLWRFLHRVAPDALEQPARIGAWPLCGFRDARLT